VEDIVTSTSTKTSSSLTGKPPIVDLATWQAAADELMAPDATIHQPEVGGVAGLKAFNTIVRTAFPDWYSTAEELIIEGDRVAERLTGRGTHRGEFQGIPPTGKQVAVPGVVFYRGLRYEWAEDQASADAVRNGCAIGVRQVHEEHFDSSSIAVADGVNVDRS
jgi:predicted ester cyclase